MKDTTASVVACVILLMFSNLAVAGSVLFRFAENITDRNPSNSLSIQNETFDLTLIEIGRSKSGT